MCLNAGPLTLAILPREGRHMTEEDIAVLWLWVPAAVMSRRSSLDKISGVHFKGRLVYNTPSEVALLSMSPQLMNLQWAASEPKHLNWPIQSNKIETVILIIPTRHTHTKKKIQDQANANNFIKWKYMKPFQTYPLKQVLQC